MSDDKDDFIEELARKLHSAQIELEKLRAELASARRAYDLAIKDKEGLLVELESTRQYLDERDEELDDLNTGFCDKLRELQKMRDLIRDLWDGASHLAWPDDMDARVEEIIGESK